MTITGPTCGPGLMTAMLSGLIRVIQSFGGTMIDAIHQSTLNMFLRCGEQGQRRYLKNEIIPPGVAAARGTGVHRANEANLRQKISSGVDLPVSDLKDAARDGYIKALSNGVFLPRDELPAKNRLINEGLNETIVLTELYHDEVAPEIVPLDVERKFLIDVGLELPLSGIIDIEQDNRVDDLKTSARTWPDTRIKSEIQPVFYSFAHQREIGVRPEFHYHILIPLKSGAKRQVQSMVATDADYKALFAKIEVVIQMLKTGLFPPANPSSWWCSEKWCGYWTTCKYVGN